MATTDPTTALVLLDLQSYIIDLARASESYLALVAAVREAAKAAGLPVVHVRTCFREGYVDVSSNNKTMARHKGANGLFVEGHSSAEFHSATAPAAAEAVVTKRRVSAFASTDLEVVLRSMGVRAVVLAGISTSGAVLSTLRQAADMDYQITVLEDLCLDLDPEVHRVLMEKVFTRQATVVKSDAWIAAVSGSQ